MEDVIIEWICKSMSKTLNDRYFVKVCLESIYLKNNGWLCDCGKWTTGDDKDHIPIDKGKREIYELPNSGNSKLWVMVGSG